MSIQKRGGVMQAIMCNRCNLSLPIKTEIDPKHGRYNIYPEGWLINISRTHSEAQTVDLCVGCSAELQKWIEEGA
jgi:hypothetical protein